MVLKNFFAAAAMAMIAALPNTAWSGVICETGSAQDSALMKAESPEAQKARLIAENKELVELRKSLTKRYVSSGLDPKAAEKKAYDEILAIKVKKQEEAKRLAEEASKKGPKVTRCYMASAQSRQFPNSAKQSVAASRTVERKTPSGNSNIAEQRSSGSKIVDDPLMKPRINEHVASAHYGPKVDRVRVRKAAHVMELISNGKTVRKFVIALGTNPKGHKQRRGDNRTPEGTYILDRKGPSASYYLSFHISYPNAEDRKRARELGVDPGGLIAVHGQPNHLGFQSDEDSDGEVNADKFVQPQNWTNGCIALLNADMKEFFERVSEGTPIEILP